MPTGTPIYSTFDGTIRVAKWNKSYGNLIVIRHDNGLETYYAHLSRIQVKPGQEVKAGEQIGLAGNTGRSYGSHLHFETRYLGAAINPDVIIDFSDGGHKLKSDTLQLTASCFRKKGNNNQYAGGGSSQYYRVRKGDTLGAIARRNGTTVNKLCRLNGLKKTSIIRPGQRLKLR
jgi:murein DD-endopeptidase MepM/ murein hydrolase activator NlpD